MKSATSLLATVAASLLAVGCGGNPSPPAQNPSTSGPTQPIDTNGNPSVDPASGTSDLNSATNSATAPPGAPESMADPGGHAPVVSTGKSSGDTPINSGGGDAIPEQKKP